ncbi:lipoprotein [Gammaproteobacteria bacterium AB-CW1]|uniref:Lipoprotein n=1 Tax=Natronospira elongata TaxID=3110268 RepID=A0AAP6MJZ1_9GAMM|nr:lipoprotein [Gammaproteobacteria bacterium AB-CW1]
MTMRIASLLLVALLLAGCGQKGPLFLPEPEEEESQNESENNDEQENGQ